MWSYLQKSNPRDNLNSYNRLQLVLLAYSKLMRMSVAENHSDEKIDVLNLLSTDASRVNQSAYVAVYMVVAPLAIIVNTVILITQISFSTLGGLILLLLGIPLQIILNTKLTKIK